MVRASSTWKAMSLNQARQSLRSKYPAAFFAYRAEADYRV